MDDDGSYCPKCAEPTGVDAEEFWEEHGSQGIFVCHHCKARLVAGWDDYESPDGWWAFELAREANPSSINMDLLTDVRMPVDYSSVANPEPIKVQAVVTDRRALIRVSDLSITPSRGDTLTEVDGTAWLIASVSGRSGVYWELGLTKRLPSS